MTAEAKLESYGLAQDPSIGHPCKPTRVNTKLIELARLAKMAGTSTSNHAQNRRSRSDNFGLKNTESYLS